MAEEKAETIQTEAAENTTPDTAEKKELTPDDLQARLEEQRDALRRDADRRVAEANKKWEREKAEFMKKLELDRMSEEDRVKAVAEEKARELQEKESEIKQREMDFETVRILAEKKLPTKLLDVLKPIGDLETRKTAVAEFEKLVQGEVARVLKDRERGSFTKESGTQKLTKEQLNQMSTAEVNALFKTAEGKKLIEEAMKA